MAQNSDEILPTPKPSSMFSFTTTVASSMAQSTNAEIAQAPERKTFSPTKELLPLYISHLERFQFADAARVLSLASRDSGQIWVLLPHLQLLTACESIYHSLIFLEAFSTNQYLETMYAEVKSAIERVYETWSKKMGEIQKARTPRGANAAADVVAARLDSAVSFYCTLLSDLVIYLDCRSKLVDLRVLLHKGFLEATPALLKQGLATLSGILVHLPQLKHALIVQLAQNMLVEVQLFSKILTIELAIANYQANSAIFSFYALEAELTACLSKFTFLKDKVETSTFLDTALFHWFESIRDSLCEKMQFLFAEFRSLRSNGTQINKNEPFTQEAGAKLALYEKIVEFTANSGAFNVSLILRPADGMGSGKSSWVPVYTFPQDEAPFKHWPSIISLYQDNMELLDNPSSPPPILHKSHSSMIVPIPASLTPSASGSNVAALANQTAPLQPSAQQPGLSIPDQANMAQRNSPAPGANNLQNIPLNILHYYDTHVDTTYYMATLQPKMLLVVIFKGERQQDDSEVTAFMKGLFAKLRHSQLLQKVLTRAPGTSSPAALSRSSTPMVLASVAPTATV